VCVVRILVVLRFNGASCGLGIEHSKSGTASGSVAGARARQQPGDQNVSIGAEEDSVLSARATQILQRQLSRSTQTLHFGSKPRDGEQSRTEKNCAIEVDHRQGVSFPEPVLLARGRRERQGPTASDLYRHGPHTEIQYMRIPLLG